MPSKRRLQHQPNIVCAQHDYQLPLGSVQPSVHRMMVSFAVNEIR